MYGLEKKEVMRGTFSRLTSEDSISLKLQVTDGETAWLKLFNLFLTKRIVEQVFCFILLDIPVQ
jgi:hypothetical protein